jgi:hypothetical protein
MAEAEADKRAGRRAAGDEARIDDIVPRGV